MIYQATIFIENKPKRFLFFWHTKRIVTKLSDFLVEAENREEGEAKVLVQVEEYKKIDHKFFSDKIFKTFLLPPK